MPSRLIRPKGTHYLNVQGSKLQIYRPQTSLTSAPSKPMRSSDFVVDQGHSDYASSYRESPINPRLRVVRHPSDGDAQSLDNRHLVYVLGVREFAGLGPGLDRLAQIQHHAPFDFTCLDVGEDRVDVAQRRGFDIGPYLAVDANAMASSRSRRVPTMEPRTVIRFRTTSKIGVGNSPGGRPTRLTVPLRRTMRNA